MSWALGVGCLMFDVCVDCNRVGETKTKGGREKNKASKKRCKKSNKPFIIL